jgi:hypothetical protein
VSSTLTPEMANSLPTSTVANAAINVQTNTKTANRTNSSVSNSSHSSNALSNSANGTPSESPANFKHVQKLKDRQLKEKDGTNSSSNNYLSYAYSNSVTKKPITNASLNYVFNLSECDEISIGDGTFANRKDSSDSKFAGNVWIGGYENVNRTRKDNPLLCPTLTKTFSSNDDIAPIPSLRMAAHFSECIQ